MGDKILDHGRKWIQSQEENCNEGEIQIPPPHPHKKKSIVFLSQTCLQ
jgi:hypothetical protein